MLHHRQHKQQHPHHTIHHQQHHCRTLVHPPCSPLAQRQLFPTNLLALLFLCPPPPPPAPPLHRGRITIMHLHSHAAWYTGDTLSTGTGLLCRSLHLVIPQGFLCVTHGWVGRNACNGVVLPGTCVWNALGCCRWGADGGCCKGGFRGCDGYAGAFCKGNGMMLGGRHGGVLQQHALVA